MARNLFMIEIEGIESIDRVGHHNMVAAGSLRMVVSVSGGNSFCFTERRMSTTGAEPPFCG
jgi:hypothetical protein